MPNFRHGKNSRLIVSTIEASSLFNEMTMTHSVDTAETTVFGLDDRTYIAGQRDGSFSASGFLDATTAGTGDPFAKFRAALGSTTNLIITAVPGAVGGSTLTPGSMCHMGSGVVTGFETAAPAMGVVTAKFDAQFSDRYDIGRITYAPGTVKNTTSSGTSVDSGVVLGTAGGGVSHFHITQQGGANLTSVTLKTQHSSAAAVWADVHTFTSTSTGVSRVASTGTIKRYVRGTISAISGATPAVKFTIAFARRGSVA